jgi:hypothetical protein
MKMVRATCDSGFGLRNASAGNHQLIFLVAGSHRDRNSVANAETTDYMKAIYYKDRFRSWPSHVTSPGDHFTSCNVVKSGISDDD